ncbi:MAG: ABC transporter ATP-binding protein [Spirochaetaceae bacterium]
MVEIRGADKYYGHEAAVRELTLSLEEKQSCAVVGPSGCGKTTLLHLIAGLIIPERGEVLVHGEPLGGPRSTTGLIMQEDALLPWFTVGRNIKIGLRAARLSHEEIEKRTEWALERMEMRGQSEKFPSQLSGGQRQRVAIGRTLVTHPDLLLMDEPTSALDEMSKERLQDLILHLYLEAPRTMVFVTHSIEEAVFLGRTVLVMNQGRLIKKYNNPGFGNPNLRDTEEFYRLVLEIRRDMKETFSASPDSSGTSGSSGKNRPEGGKP